MHTTISFYSSANVAEDVQLADLKSFKQVHFPHYNLLTRSVDVNHVAALMSNFDKLPPIKVVKTSQGLLIVDGYHRYNAAKQLGKTTIAVHYVQFTTANDVILAALDANTTHGRASNKKERTNYIIMLHLSNFKMSQDDIAKRVGVHQSVVSRTIANYKKKGAGAIEQITDTPYEDMQLHKIMKLLLNYITVSLKDIPTPKDDVSTEDLVQQATTILTTKFLAHFNDLKDANKNNEDATKFTNILYFMKDVFTDTFDILAEDEKSSST